jgi:hypothetical protein
MTDILLWGVFFNLEQCPSNSYVVLCSDSGGEIRNLRPHFRFYFDFSIVLIMGQQRIRLIEIPIIVFSDDSTAAEVQVSAR